MFAFGELLSGSIVSWLRVDLSIMYQETIRIEKSSSWLALSVGKEISLRCSLTMQLISLLQKLLQVYIPRVHCAQARRESIAWPQVGHHDLRRQAQPRCPRCQKQQPFNLWALHHASSFSGPVPSVAPKARTNSRLPNAVRWPCTIEHFQLAWKRTTWSWAWFLLRVGSAGPG